MTNPLYNFDPRRIPIIGNDIYQAGQVWSIVNQTCTPNPTIAVKAFFAYAPTLIWSLVKPEALDLAFDRAGTRHKRKRYKKFNYFDHQQIELPKGSKSALALFKVADIAQRVGWYLLIADATTDFALNWVSMAYQYGGCDVPNANYAYWRGNMAAPIAEASSPVQIYGPDHAAAGKGISSQTLLILQNIGPYTITYQGYPLIFPSGPNPPGIISVDVQIRTSNGPWISNYATESQVPNSTFTKWEFAYENWNTNEKTVECRVIVTWQGGSMMMVNQVLQMAGGNAANFLADP